MNSVVVASRSKALFASLREMLGKEFELQFAERLPQVFEALTRRPVDVAFVDTRLADCEGRDAISEITSAFPEVSLIYIAPGEEGSASELAGEEGVYACLRKPLNRGTVRFLAEKAVERRKLSRRIEYLTSLAEGTPTEDFARRADRMPAEHRGETAPLNRGMVRSLLRSVTPIADLNKLLGRFADSVRELFGSNNVAIFAWDSRKGRYVAGAWQGVDEGLAEVCSFSKKHGMVRWLLEHQQLLTRSKLGKAFPHDVAVEVATDMDALRAEVIMPLLERGNLVAFLSLGTKMTGKRYDEEDLELLAVIGDCASGAISTSLLHREISFQKAMAEAVLKNIACGIVVVDGEAKIVSVNYFAESALDLNSAELVGRSVQKLGSVLADMVLRTTKEDQTFVNRPYQDKATGRVFAVSTCRMYEDTLGAAAVILFFTPLPEVPSIVPEEGKLLEDEKFSSFCGHIADRVKNPLASIKTFSQLLPEKFDDTEFREKFSQIVGRAVERINSLADGLTAYAGTGPLDLAPTNIGAVIENTVAGLRKNLHARKLHVAGPGSDKPAMALADGQLIRSAFLNVLKNSIESTTADGSITISVKKVSAKELREEKARDASRVLCDNTGITGKDGAVPDDEMFVETEFRDSGKGIAEAEMGKVGEPFFTTKGESIGLGMAIVRKIVGRHRGKMEIESKEGIGTTVRIILRAEQNAR